MASVTSGGQRYGYTYDSMGNIATFSAPGKGTVTYTYDNQGQLLKAAGDTTYTYTYDGAGNILTASDGTATHSYTYGDTNWKDLLTAFDGQAITYDAIGNPTSYFNGTRWNFTWVNGRSLATASDGTNSLSFAYDASGLRTSKTVNGTTYRYYYAGGKLMRMTWGTNTIDFFYDANGTPYAMKYNGTVYYYITNLQGDVMRIVDASQNTVTSYDYDPYGKVISATGTLANINPLRYRGYVYDQETGFYYLQSRYYDPAVGRFINVDGFVSAGPSIIGKNMYAYCGNNPVNRCDSTGCFWLAALLTVTVTALILSGCTEKTVSNAAPKYYKIAESNGDRNHNPNCYAYVLGYYGRSYDIGEFSDTYPTGKTVDAIAECVVSDLNKLERGCRIIESYDTPIEDNEYRIALRVGEQPVVGPNGYPYLQWDYHFMVQTESGEWAEKRGSSSATILHTSGNPSIFQWDAATYPNFYTSDIIYFAITN